MPHPRWLVSALVCAAAVLCGACAFRAPAPVAVAQAQGRHTDCEFADELSDCRGRSRSRASDDSTAAARAPPKLDMAQTCKAAAQSSIGRGKQVASIKNGPRRNNSHRTGRNIPLPTKSNAPT